MGLVGFLVAFVIAAIILRLLRRAFEWIDYVAYAIIVIVPIVVWVSSGFWWAVLALIVTSIVVSLLFGLNNETKLKYKGINCKITCYKCDYGEMEILEYIEGGVLARCKRCGDSRPYYYKNE